MGLFDFFKKKQAPVQHEPAPTDEVDHWFDDIDDMPAPTGPLGQKPEVKDEQ